VAFGRPAVKGRSPDRLNPASPNESGIREVHQADNHVENGQALVPTSS
jgi:hypothetical protein